MPRVPRSRQHAASACYHVINRGHNRERILDDDEDRTFFLHLLTRYRNRFGLRLYDRRDAAAAAAPVERPLPRQLTPFRSPVLTCI
jgi:hypothetical protein